MDTAALIEPLPGGDGCGPDLALTPAFDALARLREEDDAALAQGEWRRPPRAADWPEVQRRCADLLRSATKDLRLAGWWTEAASLLHGPAGLADGIGVVAALLDRFGGDLHPRVERDDADARVAALRWLLVLIRRRAGTAPLVRIGRHGFGADAIAAARRRDGDRADEPATDDGGPPGITAIRRAAAAAGAASLDAHEAAWRRADAALTRVEHLCDAALGAEGPSFGAAHEALAAAAAATRLLAREAGIGSAAAAAAGDRPGGGRAGAAWPTVRDGSGDARAAADAAGRCQLGERDGAREAGGDVRCAADEPAGASGSSPGRFEGASSGGSTAGSPRHDGSDGDEPEGDAVESDGAHRDGSRGDEPLGDEARGDEARGEEARGEEALHDEARGEEPFGDESLGDEPHGREPRGDEPADREPSRVGPAGDGPAAAAAVPAPARRTAVRSPSADGRDAAIAHLRAAAGYFRAAEPHSPAGYLADKALRWATMPLHLWLREVLHDDAARARIEDLLGCADDGSAATPVRTD